MRTWMVVVMCVMAPGIAAAKGKHPIYEIVSGLGTPASNKYLDVCAAVVLPNGELRKAPRTLSVKDLGLPDGTTLAVTKLQTGTFGKTELEWIDADVDAKLGGKVVAKLRLVAIASTMADSPMLGVHPAAGDTYPIMVAQWAKPISDKDAKKLTINAPTFKDEKVPAPAGLSELEKADYEVLLEGDLEGGDDIGPMLADAANDGAVVIGSGPGELWKGKAGGKAIKGWKTKINHTGGTFRVGAGRAHVMIARYDGVVPYVGMIAYSDFMSGGGSMMPQLSLASFAVPQ